jgi:hypothetical protein
MMLRRMEIASLSIVRHYWSRRRNRSPVKSRYWKRSDVEPAHTNGVAGSIVFKPFYIK